MAGRASGHLPSVPFPFEILGGDPVRFRGCQHGIVRGMEGKEGNLQAGISSVARLLPLVWIGAGLDSDFMR